MTIPHAVQFGMRCGLWCCLGTLVACASSKGPQGAGDDYSVLGTYLPPALADGSVLLAPVTEVYGDKDLSVDDTFIDLSSHTYAFTTATGHTLVHVLGARDYSPFQGFGHVSPDGAVEPVSLPDDVGELAYDPRSTYGTVWISGAGMADGVVLAQCYLELADIVVLAWSTDKPDTLRLLDPSNAPCNRGVVGRSAQGDSFLLAWATLGSVTIERWTVTETGLVAAGSTSLPTTATEAVAVFVEEIAPDTFVVVLRGAEGIVRSQTATADAVMPDQGNATQIRWDSEAGALLLASPLGGAIWDQSLVDVPAPSDVGFTTVRSTRVFGASVAERSEPNADLPALRIPLAYEARQLTADGFVVQDAATTPCADRDTCRELGESYLIGHAGPIAAPVGLYFVWGWDWNGAIVAAPPAR